MPLRISPVDSAGDLFKGNGILSIEEITEANVDVGQVTLSESATGVAVDTSDSGLYVAEAGGVEHYAFTSPGVVTKPGGGTCTVEPDVGCSPSDTFGTEGTEALKGGNGIGVDPASHDVYVADASSGKIDVFTPAVLPDVSTKAASGVAETAATMHVEMDERREALALCLQKLPLRDRELMLTRYEPGCGVEEAARRSGRQVH